MTRALVLNVDPTGVDPDWLVEQLRTAGATDVTLASGTPAEQWRQLADAASRPEPLTIIGSDLLAHTAVLRNLMTEPGGRTVALTGTDGSASAVREERGQVTAVGAGDSRYLGAVLVAAAALPVVADYASAAASGSPVTADDGPPTAVGMLGALVAAGPVAASRVRLLVAAQASDLATAQAITARIDAVDEDAAALRLAVKERDDFFTTYAISSWSPWVTKRCARLGLTPSGVTGISVLLAVLAAAGFAWGELPGMVGGAVLLYLSFVLDCVDGQLARYARQFNPFGGWLDTMADRAKEYLVYAGLAFGAERTGSVHVWQLAVAAMVLQTVRHQTDYWYGALHDEAARRPRAGGGRLGQLSERVQSDTGSAAYWFKRIVVFPIGERWALIALVAAFFDGRLALLAVLTWGSFAAAYTLALRGMRSLAMRVPVLTTVDLPMHRDEPARAQRLPTTPSPWQGVVRRVLRPTPFTLVAVLVAGTATALVGYGVADKATGRWLVAGAALLAAVVGVAPAGSPHDGPLDWLVPAGLRAVECLLFVAAGMVLDVPWPLVFGLLAALALRFYDTLARAEKRAAVVRRPVWDLPWVSRVVILAAMVPTKLGLSIFILFTGYLLLMFCLGTYQAWARTAR